MRFDTVFRLSIYLTLGLATLCLSSTEELFISAIPYFVIPIEVLLVVAFAVEGRWALTAAASNVIGLVIAAGSGVWIACSLLVPSNPYLENTPFPASLLPYAGPVLMVLMLAKLFRPKQVNDFWVLHSIGLMEVALGCVLAGEPAFSVWLLAYLACALWSLMLFYLYREFRQAGPGPAGAPSALAARAVVRALPAEAPPAPAFPPRSRGAAATSEKRAEEVSAPSDAPAPLLPWRWWGVWYIGRRAVGIVGLGLVLFLLTPHQSSRAWDLRTGGASNHLETGYSSLIDLNYTGIVRESDQVALQVYVVDADRQPALDLDPNQRWRGVTLDYYKDGRWMSRHKSPPGELGRSDSVPMPTGGPGGLPDLGPQQLIITYDLELRRAGGLFLAEPVALPVWDGKAVREVSVTTPGLLASAAAFAPLTTAAALFPGRIGHEPPVQALGNPDWDLPYFHPRDGTLVVPWRHGSLPRRFRFQQVVHPPEGPVPAAVDLNARYVQDRLLEQPLPRLTSWTGEVLRQLVRQRHLSPTDLVTAPDPELGAGTYLLPASRAKVAQALSDYLAASGEYTYRLEMRRQDLSVDPIEDFLCNVKQGFCEHYATGLTLMLRAAGIPARVVNGFRGAQRAGTEDGQAGWYVIRQNHAHSWVEALIPRAGPDGRREFYWLMLDPTPSREARAADGFSWAHWWRDGQNTLRDLWKGMVLDYNFQKQIDAAAALWGSAAPEERLAVGGVWVREQLAADGFGAFLWPLLTLVLAGGLGWWRWRARKRRSPRPGGMPPAEVEFLQRCLAVLARYCRLRRSPAQTPQELSDLAAQTLRTLPAAAHLADVPAGVVRLYYRLRFGGRPPAAEERAAIDRRVTELEVALTVKPAPAR